MIISFTHKGLARFYKTGQTIKVIITNLDQAESQNDMDLPSLRLHELKGVRKNIWSVFVSDNWRVTFRFVDRDVEMGPQHNVASVRKDEAKIQETIY